MSITYGDHLIDSGYYDITPEQEREIEARAECERAGIDPDEICADGGVTAWMVVEKEMLGHPTYSEIAGKYAERWRLADARLSIAVEALRAIHGRVWRDNETSDERVGDLKSLALIALTAVADKSLR